MINKAKNNIRNKKNNNNKINNLKLKKIKIKILIILVAILICNSKKDKATILAIITTIKKIMIKKNITNMIIEKKEGTIKILETQTNKT